MMLAQTFYMIEQNDEDAASSGSSMELPDQVARSKRIFIKNRITDHPIWEDEEFWKGFKCLVDSLCISFL
jgi:hypothetical protein